MIGKITRKQIEESLKGFNDWKKPDEYGVYIAYDGKKVKITSFKKNDKEDVAKHTKIMKELSDKLMLILPPSTMDKVYSKAYDEVNKPSMFSTSKKTTNKKPTKPVWIDNIMYYVTILNGEYEKLEKEKESRFDGKISSKADVVIEKFLDKWEENYLFYLQQSAIRWKESFDEFNENPMFTSRYDRSYEAYAELNYTGNIYKYSDDGEFIILDTKISKKELSIIKEYLSSKDTNKLVQYVKDLRVKEKVKLIKNMEKYGKIRDIKSMTIGVDGRLNGKILTDKGTVSVVSFYAGGYDIQALHIRHKATLLKK